jgi:hypothetical protein
MQPVTAVRNRFDDGRAIFLVLKQAGGRPFAAAGSHDRQKPVTQD